MQQKFVEHDYHERKRLSNNLYLLDLHYNAWLVKDEVNGIPGEQNLKTMSNGTYIRG
jgi:hypothetical protein